MSKEADMALAELIGRVHGPQDQSMIEMRLDDSNKVSFPDYPYTFEALHEQILVSIDLFKDGNECPVCKGRGKIKYKCQCVIGGHDRFKYNPEQIEAIGAELGEQMALARSVMICPECHGDPSSVAEDRKCTECDGMGRKIIMLANAKQQPTTGVVVSMGKIAREKADFKVGDRILFGAFAGQMIATKAGLMFKKMDWYAANVKIEGGEDMAAFDFVMQD